MKTFKLSISTPIGKTLEFDNAKQINAYTLEGRIGVLANHSPLISSLKISDFSIELDNGEIVLGVLDGGIFNVTADEVTILTTRFDLNKEVLVGSAKQEISEVEELLRKQDLQEVEMKSLQDRLKYANLQLSIAK